MIGRRSRRMSFPWLHNFERKMMDDDNVEPEENFEATEFDQELAEVLWDPESRLSWEEVRLAAAAGDEQYGRVYLACTKAARRALTAGYHR